MWLNIEREIEILKTLVEKQGNNGVILPKEAESRRNKLLEL